MPIVTDEQLKMHLATGRIGAISVDTNIFDQKRLQFNSASMQALTRLKERPFRLILSSTVAREVVVHLVKATTEALQAARKSIGQALFSFETDTPTREEILEKISGGRSPSDAANQRWNKFIIDTGCEILDDAEIVPTAVIYNSYFSGEPPFGKGRKKDEFPDALALHALERAAAREGTSILVVSNDGDWRGYCEQSDRLFLVTQIERALALVTDAPIGLKTAIYTWLEETGHHQAQEYVYRDVARFEFTADAHASQGDVEPYAMAGELREISWPDEVEVDIIDIEEINNRGGLLQVVISMPLELKVHVPIQLNFSIWDGIDKETMPIGSREIDVEEDISVRASLTIFVHQFSSDGEFIEVVDSEIESRYHQINLGEVNIFDSEDYYDGTD